MRMRGFNSAVLAIALCAAIALPVSAQHRQKKTYKQVIAGLEEQWRMAQANNDVATVDKLLAEDYIGISSQGMVSTKAETLARMQARQVVVHKLEVRDEKIAIHGDTAVVTSEVEVDATNNATQPPTQIHSSLRYTRVYLHYPSGAWRIVNFESTHINDRPHSREDSPAAPARP